VRLRSSCRYLYTRRGAVSASRRGRLDSPGGRSRRRGVSWSCALRPTRRRSGMHMAPEAVHRPSLRTSETACRSVGRWVDDVRYITRAWRIRTQLRGSRSIRRDARARARPPLGHRPDTTLRARPLRLHGHKPVADRYHSNPPPAPTRKPALIRPGGGRNGTMQRAQKPCTHSPSYSRLDTSADRRSGREANPTVRGDLVATSSSPAHP
jgi:hypothetical protein